MAENAPTTAPRACHCIIAHPTTEEGREAAAEALDYARRINDPDGIVLRVAQLTGAPNCPANKAVS